MPAPEPFIVVPHVTHGGMGCTRSICDRCVSRRARYSTSAGPLCASCERRVCGPWRQLVSSYPLSPIREDYRADLVEEGLVGDDGVVTLRPSSAGAWMHLVYRPDAADAVAALESRAQLVLQAGTVSRILFGAALLRYIPLQGWPRSGGLYTPEDLQPHEETIYWAAGHKSCLVWLLWYGRLLLEEIKTTAGRGQATTHKALTKPLPWMRAMLRREQGAFWPPCPRLDAGRPWPPVPSHPAVQALGRAPHAGPHRVQRKERAA